MPRAAPTAQPGRPLLGAAPAAAPRAPRRTRPPAGWLHQGEDTPGQSTDVRMDTHSEPLAKLRAVMLLNQQARTCSQTSAVVQRLTRGVGGDVKQLPPRRVAGRRQLRLWSTQWRTDWTKYGNSPPGGMSPGSQVICRMWRAACANQYSCMHWLACMATSVTTLGAPPPLGLEGRVPTARCSASASALVHRGRVCVVIARNSAKPTRAAPYMHDNPLCTPLGGYKPRS